MTTIVVETRIAALIEVCFDLAQVRACGAKAISFGSIFLRYPWRPTAFVKRECTFPA